MHWRSVKRTPELVRLSYPQKVSQSGFHLSELTQLFQAQIQKVSKGLGFHQSLSLTSFSSFSDQQQGLPSSVFLYRGVAGFRKPDFVSPTKQIHPGTLQPP